MATLLKGVADPISLGLDSATHALSGGGFPLLVGGSLAGCVGVSGLPDVDDHALVVEGSGCFVAPRVGDPAHCP